MGQVTTIPTASQGRFQAVDRFIRQLRALDPDKVWEVSVAEKRRRRSDQQNRLLWSLYADILKMGGEAMRGWNKDDLHEFFLGNFHGWETVEMFGKRKQRPMKRSSKLNRQEFSDFVESIVVFMAERGVVLKMPEDL